jgi:hypothetical protein
MFVAAMVWSCTLAGCSTKYPITGRAVAGEFGAAMFVSADDELLELPGLAYAEIRIYRDPTKPNRQQVAAGRTGPRGEIDMMLTKFGAGWMIEQWAIQVVKPGYETVESLVTLPKKKDLKQLLIVMPRGVSIPPASQDSLWDEADRYR